MSVRRYRRKPKQSDHEDQFAARYEPGQPLDDLVAVARMAGSEAEVCEVVFPSGKPVLLARSIQSFGDALPKPAYEVVEAGDYLAFSSRSDFLYNADDADWRQFYDLVSDGG